MCSPLGGLGGDCARVPAAHAGAVNLSLIHSSEPVIMWQGVAKIIKNAGIIKNCWVIKNAGIKDAN